jgi:hypothetical protein
VNEDNTTGHKLRLAMSTLSQGTTDHGGVHVDSEPMSVETEKADAPSSPAEDKEKQIVEAFPAVEIMQPNPVQYHIDTCNDSELTVTTTGRVSHHSMRSQADGFHLRFFDAEKFSRLNIAILAAVLEKDMATATKQGPKILIADDQEISADWKASIPGLSAAGYVGNQSNLTNYMWYTGATLLYVTDLA